ncbi:MAG: class I SAM-dependent methyltransferase [Nitrospinae bacterium]|nr:class I SAM-dependent methyltransferase [Nitrospinota bacterium]
MNHNGKVFDARNWRKLESPERLEKMNPEKLAAAMGLTGAESVLDLGCGTGFFAAPVARICAKLYGVDISPEMLSIFGEKLKNGSSPNVELLLGNGKTIPLEDGALDVVFHVNLFHEIDDHKAFHAEITRVLKPGGRLFTVDWRAIETEGGPPLSHRIPEDKAEESLKRDGFSSIRHINIYDSQYVIGAEASK